MYIPVCPEPSGEHFGVNRCAYRSLNKRVVGDEPSVVTRKSTFPLVRTRKPVVIDALGADVTHGVTA